MQQETEDSASVTIKPGWGFSGDYQPGQYVGIGLRIDGRWHWRSYSLTSIPQRDKKLISITVKATPEGFLSSHLVNGVKPGTIVRLAAPKGDFALPNPPPAKVLLVSAGSGITPIMAMLRALKARGESPDIVHIHSAPSVEDVIFHDELRKLDDDHTGYRLKLQLTQDAGHLDFAALDDIVGGLGPAPDLGVRTAGHARRRSRRSGPMPGCRTICTPSVSSSRAPTRVARAAPSPSRSQTRRSRQTAPPRCWRPAKRSAFRCPSDAEWVSANPACCRWNPATSAISGPGTEHGAGDRIQTCISAASGDCTLKI